MLSPDWLDLYLQEDLGDEGDITSDPVFPDGQLGAGQLVVRERCFLAGTSRAAELFRRLGCTVEILVADGQWIGGNTAVLTVEGPAKDILRAERIALNIVGRMSGIATMTREVMETLGEACSAAQVAATRKTTPGFRLFEKEAVTIAGGDAHRAGLFSAAMIKDNHREAAGDLKSAIRAIQSAHPSKEITVEVETESDALLAAAEGVTWILIDNQDGATGKSWAESVWNKYPNVKMEASGGITADNVTEYGWADRIGMGALTTQATSVDVSLEWSSS